MTGKTELALSESSAIEYIEVAGDSVRQILGKYETTLDEGMICLCIMNFSYVLNPGMITITSSLKRVLSGASLGLVFWWLLLLC